MSTQYRLVPPFLHVPEQQDFSKAWEHFCCKLLNLSHRTTEIYVRNPPEQGVDLFYPSSKIAYQCKSVESGKSGDFNVTKAVESIKAALCIQAELGWKTYVLCVNVAISGKAEAALKAALPGIEILPESYWAGLCENHPQEVERNFRRLIEVPRARVLTSIQNRFVEHYSARLQAAIDESSFDLLLYTNRHDAVYRVPVSATFTCKDLLGIFRSFFKLPESRTISSEGIDISIAHSVVFEGKAVSLGKTLAEAGMSHGSVVTYWTQFRWSEAKAEFDGDVMYLMTSDMLARASRSLSERKERALAEFSIVVSEHFTAFDDSL